MTIGEGWAKYERECIPTGTGGKERMHLREAFYTAAAVVITEQRNAVRRGDIRQSMQKASAELQAFYKMITKQAGMEG